MSSCKSVVALRQQVRIKPSDFSSYVRDSSGFIASVAPCLTRALHTPQRPVRQLYSSAIFWLRAASRIVWFEFDSKLMLFESVTLDVIGHPSLTFDFHGMF